MADLETAIRKSQIERLPISKGEVLLQDLACRYPNLEHDMLEEHEARKFISNLGTSFPSSTAGISMPSPLIDWKHPSSKSSIGKSGKRSAARVSISPNSRPTVSDFIFDMDYDIEAGSASRAIHPSEKVDKNPWRDVIGKPLKEQPSSYAVNQRFRVFSESLSTDLNRRDGSSEIKTPDKRWQCSDVGSNCVASESLRQNASKILHNKGLHCILLHRLDQQVGSDPLQFH